MKHLELDGKVLLNKLEDLDAPDREPSDGDVVAVILDVETTGLNHERDEVIQIALRPFFVNPTTGEVSGLKKTMVAMQQPTNPLPKIITEITGFCDEDLEGHSIPWEKVLLDQTVLFHRQILKLTKGLIPKEFLHDLLLLETSLYLWRLNPS